MMRRPDGAQSVPYASPRLAILEYEHASSLILTDEEETLLAFTCQRNGSCFCYTHVQIGNMMGIPAGPNVKTLIAKRIARLLKKIEKQCLA